MTVEISLAIVISILSLLFSVYMGIRGNKRTDTKDVEERAKERAEINVKLGFISSTTQDIKEQISSVMKDVQNHGVKIAELEQSMRSVNHRIDGIEQRLNKEEE